MNRKICAFDVGRVNMGVAVLQAGKFIYCAVASLKKKERINDEVERLVEFLYKKFGRFDIVSIELQRAGVIKRIQLLLEKACEKISKNVVIVAPQSIKRYFSFSGLKKYADRKRVGCEKAMLLCKQLNQMDMYFQIARGRDKSDDIFDAMLIAYYVYAEPSVLQKKVRKKKPVDLNAWGKTRIWSVTAAPKQQSNMSGSSAIPVLALPAPASKKRKLRV